MNDLIDAALLRAQTRAAERLPVDYDKLNRMVKRQRAALTRASKSGDLDKLVETIKAAVSEWDTPGLLWPDDWSRWQRVLDDALPFHQHVDIRDL